MFPLLRRFRAPNSQLGSRQLSPSFASRARRALFFLLLAASVCVAWNRATAQSGVWTWKGGSSTVPGEDEGRPGIYGSPGVPAPANIPGGRGAAALWTDQSGNVWLFGGYGFDINGNVSYLNDLWELSPSTNEWAWMSGSSSIGTNGGQPGVYGTLGTAAAGNVPGGRAVPSAWIDTSGNLWLFGGYGFDSVGALSTLNDVWEFSPSTMLWTWVGGSSTIGPDFGQSGIYGTQGTPASGNIPGSRYFSTGWTDSSGNFWLFGGYGFAGNGLFGSLNDLWELNPSTNEWTWMGGSNTIPADNGGQNGVYGSPGIPAPGNTPGGRGYAANLIDSNDNVWLFGGGGFDADGDYGYLNDMWELDPANLEWTWMGGSSTVTPYSGQPGVYGVLGTPAAGNIPGGRETAIGWLGSGDKLWLFGGSGYDANDTFGSLGDLWEFNPVMDEWVWMGGSSMPGDVGQAGIYGRLGAPAAANFPGGRYYVANWKDANGAFWMFGGLGEDAKNTGGFLNDLWRFQPASALSSPAPGSALAGPSVTFTWGGAVAATGSSLWLGSTGVGSNNLYDSGETTGTSVTAKGLPNNGETIYARLYTNMDGITVHTDYTYTAASQAVLTTPAPGSTLTASSVTFSWTASPGATGYSLLLGSTGVGSSNLYNSGEVTATSASVTGLPMTGETIYARLSTTFNGSTVHYDYTYATLAPAALTSPAPGSVLAGIKATFAWTSVSGATAYSLQLGSTGVGSSNLYNSGNKTVTSLTVSGLPTNGEKIYARLTTDFSGVLVSQDYIYTAVTLGLLTTPAPGTVLAGATVTFTWKASTGTPTGYSLWIGSTGVGSSNLYNSHETTGTSATAKGLPTNSETLYVRLYTNFNGVAVPIDYTYNAAP